VDKRIFERKELFEYIAKNSHDICRRGLNDSQDVLVKRLDTFFKFALNYSELDDQYKKELKHLFFYGKEENITKIFSKYNEYFDENENTRIGHNSQRMLGIIRDVSTVLSEKALRYINNEISEEDFYNYIENKEYFQKIGNTSEYKNRILEINENNKESRINLRNHILNNELLLDNTKEFLANVENNIREYNKESGMATYIELLTNSLGGFDKYGKTFYSELNNIKKDIISKDEKNDLSQYTEILNSSFDEFKQEFKERKDHSFVTDYFRGQVDRLNYARDKDILLSFSDFNRQSKINFFKNYLIQNIDSPIFKIPKTLQNKKVIKKYPDVSDNDIINFLDNDLKIKHISNRSRRDVIKENFEAKDINSKTIRKILTEPEYSEYSMLSGLNYRDSNLGFINADNHKIIQKLAEDKYSKEDISRTVRHLYLDVDSEEEKQKQKEIRNYLKEKSKSSEFLILHNMMQEYLKNDSNFSENENDIQVLDLSTIPNGNYVLTLSNSTRFSTHKVNVVK